MGLTRESSSLSARTTIKSKGASPWGVSSRSLWTCLECKAAFWEDDELVIAQSEKVSESRIAIQIEVDADRVEEALQRAYQKVVREVSVPGFRKGKVPRRIIEARFGVEVLYEDALEELIPSAYEEAVTEAKLDVIDQPDVSNVEIEAGSPLRFRVEVDVMPEATLGEYKGLKAVKSIERVEESDIDHMLEHLRDENAELVPVERESVEEGDFVLIDFEGYIDGEPFQGGAAKGYTLELGSGRFIEGFEEQLVGKEIGSDVDVHVTFPEEYQSEELAGKDALFKVHIHSAQVRVLPELDDEFAVDVSEAESLEELRQQIREELAESAAARADQELRDELVKMASDASTVDVPEVLVNREVDHTLNEFFRGLTYRGIDPQQYLEQTERTLDDLREQFQSEAESRVKANIVLSTIVKNEGIAVDTEELEAHVERVVSESNDPDSTRKMLEDPDRRASLERSLEIEKAVELLLEHAEIEEKEIPSRGHGHNHDHDDHDHEDQDDHGDQDESEPAADKDNQGA